jgi:hypothetical protein
MKKRPLRPAVVTVAVLGAAFLAASPACADPPPRPAGCPATPPRFGTRCAPAGLSCGYRACGDRWSTTAVCDAHTHQWGVSESSCNPPVVTRPSANPPNAPPPRPRRPRRPEIHRNPPGHPPRDPYALDL